MSCATGGVSTKILLSGRWSNIVWNNGKMGDQLAMMFSTLSALEKFSLCENCHASPKRELPGAPPIRREELNRSKTSLDKTFMWMQQAGMAKKRPKRKKIRQPPPKTPTEIFLEKLKKISAFIQIPGENVSRKDQLVSENLDIVTRFGPKTVANVFHCCQLGHYENKELFELMAQKWLSDFPGEIQAQTYSTVWEALAFFASTEDNYKELFESYEVFVRNLVQQGSKKHSNWVFHRDESCMAKIANAVALIFDKDAGLRQNALTKKLVQAILNKTLKDLVEKRCQSKTLASMLYVLAHKGMGTEQEINTLWTKLEKKMIENDKGIQKYLVDNELIHGLDAPSLARVVYAMAELGYENKLILDMVSKQIVEKLPAIDEVLLSELLMSYSKMGYTDPKVLDAVGWEVCLFSRLSNFRVPQIVGIVHALGDLNYYHKHGFQYICKEIANQERLFSFTELDLAKLMYGFGKLGYFDKYTLAGLLERMRVKMVGYGTHDLVNAIAVLGSFEQRIRPERNFVVGQLVPFLKAASVELLKSDRLKELSREQLANLAWVLAALQYSDEKTLNAFINSFLEKSGDIGKLEEFLQLVHACSVMYVVHTDLIEKTMELLKGNMAEIQQPGWIVDALHNLAILDSLTPDMFTSICDRLLELKTDNGSDLTPFNGKIVQSWQYMSTKGGVELTDSIKELVDRPNGALTVRVHQGKSEFIQQFGKGLGNVGRQVKYRTNVLLEGIAVVVDVDVELDKGGHVAVMLDSLDDLSINKFKAELKQLGHVRLRNKLVAQQNYKVVSVPFNKWRTLDDKERIQWMKKKIPEL